MQLFLLVPLLLLTWVFIIIFVIIALLGVAARDFGGQLEQIFVAAALISVTMRAYL